MRPRSILPIATIVVALVASEASAQTRKAFTKTSGPTCRDASTDSFGKWTCGGPADYIVTFSDEGNLVSVEFGRRSKTFANDSKGAVWRAADKGFGDIIEWRVDSAGKPVAAIVRAWETTDGDRTVQSLKVFVFGADRACLFASVPASEKRTNEKVSSQAERAVGWKCSGESK